MKIVLDSLLTYELILSYTITNLKRMKMKTLKQFIMVMMAALVLEANAAPGGKSSRIVYICTTGKVYHRTNCCDGLRTAKHPIIPVTVDEAKYRYGRRGCKICCPGELTTSIRRILHKSGKHRYLVIYRK